MITILCAGSRGDFQPYIALAQELIQLGKDVRIAGMKDFKDFVTSYGIEYYPIEADFESLNVGEEMLQKARTADNPLKMLLTFNKMRRYAVSIGSEFFNSCQGSELIVYHPGVSLGFFAAEKLGIPSVLASPFPLHKTKEQTSVILYGRIKPNPLTNRISNQLLQGLLWLASKDSVKFHWHKSYGKLPKDFGCPYERHRNAKHPAVISCSNFVFRRPSDWNGNIHQYGYWFVKEKNDYTPSRELEEFISSGTKPIYIGFGSVFSTNQLEALSKKIIDALSMSGKRGILSGMGKLDNLPKNVIAVDNIPHSWLFEQVAAVCHHGGAGTTAAGFKAGVPSIIIPAANDQFAWAQRAFDLGVAPPPIPLKKLTSEKLARAFQYALQEQIVENARTLAENIATENGARDCAKVIVSCI